MGEDVDDGEGPQAKECDGSGHGKGLAQILPQSLPRILGPWDQADQTSPWKTDM